MLRRLLDQRVDEAVRAPKVRGSNGAHGGRHASSDRTGDRASLGEPTYISGASATAAGRGHGSPSAAASALAWLQQFAGSAHESARWVSGGRGGAFGRSTRSRIQPARHEDRASAAAWSTGSTPAASRRGHR